MDGKGYDQFAGIRSISDLVAAINERIPVDARPPSCRTFGAPVLPWKVTLRRITAQRRPAVVCQAGPVKSSQLPLRERWGQIAGDGLSVPLTDVGFPTPSRASLADPPTRTAGGCGGGAG